MNKDPLFVAATRPAMKWGVTLDAIILGVGLTAIIFIGTGSLLTILIYPAIHGSMFLLCLKDPRTVTLMTLWVKTKGKSLGWRHWGAATATPFINTRAKKGIPK